MPRNILIACLVFCAFCMFSACSVRSPGLFARKSPHEQYGQHIIDAGLRETALGRLWFQAAEQSLSSPVFITLPYQEAGYFAAERPQAAGWKFTAKRGERLAVVINKKPATGFLIYLDLWEQMPAESNSHRFLSSADTAGSVLNYEIKSNGQYIIRMLPELLKSGEFTVTVRTGPSLAFPVPDKVKYNIGSFWGSGRDGGARKHEGIDIFAAFRSPAVASADGIITRVNENRLGGKVVFLNPDNLDYSLYYAHLDTQIVHEGQVVKAGETVGLIGNTGNAAHTPSHLHFGIYASRGAIDPLPFVNPVVKDPSKINAPLINLDKLVRTSGKETRLYEEPSEKSKNFSPLENATLLRVAGATGNWYKVILPDGRRGFISSTKANPLNNALRELKLTAPVPMINEPDVSAARIMLLEKGDHVRILAAFSNYYYVAQKNELQGWVNKSAL